jgi:hypothetical protein
VTTRSKHKMKFTTTSSLLSLGLLGSVSADWRDAPAASSSDVDATSAAPSGAPWGGKPDSNVDATTSGAPWNGNAPPAPATVTVTDTVTETEYIEKVTIIRTTVLAGASVCGAKPTGLVPGSAAPSGGSPGQVSPAQGSGAGSGSPGSGSGNGNGNGWGSGSGSGSGNGWDAGSDGAVPTGLNDGIPGGHVIGSGSQVWHWTESAEVAPTTTQAAPTYTGWVDTPGNGGSGWQDSGPSPGSDTSNVTKPFPPLGGNSCNGPNSRSQWCGGFDINTDYYTTGPDTGKTCSYNWVITNTTLNYDGVPRLALAINGQVPGPAIECNWGDWIEVHVTNQMQNNATSVSASKYPIHQY